MIRLKPRSYIKKLAKHSANCDSSRAGKCQTLGKCVSTMPHIFLLTPILSILKYLSSIVTLRPMIKADVFLYIFFLCERCPPSILLFFFPAGPRQRFLTTQRAQRLHPRVLGTPGGARCTRHEETNSTKSGTTG